MSIQYSEYDQIDRQIAKALIEDATLTSSQIGVIVGLSPSAANERVRKLKQDGVIRGIVALLDSTFVDMDLGAFIFVSVDGGGNNASFLRQVAEHQNILECHHLTGEYSYLLKIRCKDAAALESLITNFLKSQPGVSKTMTQIILSSHKELCSVLGRK